MPMPTVGAPAPWTANLTTQDGVTVTLAQHAGKPVLLYFYPKDDTPGCTIEACNFRDHQAEIGAVIYGVSLDDATSHRAFKAKFHLPFDLLVDAGGALAKAYGVLADGGQYPARASFLIGGDGKLKAAWPKVDPKTHWLDVQAALAK